MWNTCADLSDREILKLLQTTIKRPSIRKFNKKTKTTHKTRFGVRTWRYFFSLSRSFYGFCIVVRFIFSGNSRVCPYPKHVRTIADNSINSHYSPRCRYFTHINYNMWIFRWTAKGHESYVCLVFVLTPKHARLSRCDRRLSAGAIQNSIHDWNICVPYKIDSKCFFLADAIKSTATLNRLNHKSQFYFTMGSEKQEYTKHILRI